MQAKVLATIKTNKDQIAILDVDWLSSALPILLVSDGSIRILDATLNSANSAIGDKDCVGRNFYTHEIIEVMNFSRNN